MLQWSLLHLLDSEDSVMKDLCGALNQKEYVFIIGARHVVKYSIPEASRQRKKIA